MKHTYLIILCLFTFGIMSAQKENLSKAEKERREKNIQAGNPFAKYGYKAKVATLSKGKYLEVHDLDSIVTIGTVRWNVNQNKIVGHIVQDTTDMYAQPIGDTAGRWLSPDPLSDEFPEWSPYTSMNDNPIFFVDPTGLSSETVIIKGDLAEAATEQLNSSTDGQLNITRNEETGKLSYTKTSEGPLTKDAQQLANAIDDKNITVNVEASSSTTSSKTGKELSGGEFQGSKTDFDGLGNAITDTYQQVNPNQTNNYDYANGTSGKAAQHEVVESYLGGQEAQKRGLSRVGPATKADTKNPNSVYRTSHDAAPIGNNKTPYIEKGTNRVYLRTSYGGKVYINDKK